MNTCDMFGCYEKIYNRVSIGPGTNVGVCEAHYLEITKALLPEDPSQYVEEEKNAEETT